MKSPTLEVHVPISPTPRFFNMVRCLAGSLRRFGGAYRDAPIIVTVGEVPIDPGLEERLPWLREAGVEVRWVPEELFQRDSWFATGLERFRYPFSSDVVLILDADVLVCGPLDDLVRRVDEEALFAALIAHCTPFYAEGLWQQELQIWQQLYDRCGLGRVDRPHQYTGWRPTHSAESLRNCRFCPPYFNFGVLCAPAGMINRLGDVLYPLMHEVNQQMVTDFRCQIALTLAITRLQLPYWALPLRYNFPTDQGYEDFFPEELAEVRLLHLLGRGSLDKRALYADRESLHAATLRRDLEGADETARRILAAVSSDFDSPGSITSAESITSGQRPRDVHFRDR